MSDALKPDTLQQIRDLCTKISVAHDLDDSIQEELRGHMEDKLLAYLSGDEPLSEQDAFILVREHFGDPATIKTLMHEVHPVAAQATLARRIGGALVTTLAIAVVLRWTSGPIYEFLMTTSYATDFWAYFAVNNGRILLGLIAFWLILRRWQHRLSVGAKVWFTQMRPAYSLYLGALFTGLLFATGREMTMAIPRQQDMADAAWFLTTILVCVNAAAQCLLWLWWCDTPPRRTFSVGVAAATWFLTATLSTVTAALGQSFVVSQAGITVASIPMWPSVHYLVSVTSTISFRMLLACLVAMAVYLATALARFQFKEPGARMLTGGGNG